MKISKKILSLVLVLAVVLAFSATAFAAGNASITVTNATKDKVYEVYKILDSTVNNGNVSYTLPAGKALSAPGTDWFQVSSSGLVTPTADFTEDVLKTTAFQNWAKGFGTKVASQTADADGELVFQNLDYGYYFVTSSLGSAVMVNSANSNVQIQDKNRGPSWPPSDGKRIDLGNGQTAKANTAKFNEVMNFEIPIDATDYDGTKRIFKYEITDSMDPGMTYTVAPSVSVGGTPLADTAYTVDYVPAGSSMGTATGFKISIPWTSNSHSDGDLLYAGSGSILVTYSAMLDSTKVSDISFVDANKNTATFDWYAGDPTNPGDDPTAPTGTSGDSSSETYTTEIEISKVKEDGTTALAGAEFTLSSTNGSTMTLVTGTRFVANANGEYYLLTDGTYTKTVPTTATANYYASTTQKYAPESYTELVTASGNVTMKGYVDESGKLKFSGLVPGTYTLEETVVPDGYNKAEDKTFTLSFEASNKTWDAGSDVEVENGALKITVINSSSVLMPSTGGIGTTIFYVLGSCLLLGAAVLMITRKRMSREG